MTLVVLVRNLANEAGLLEFDEAVSDALSSCQSVVLGVCSVVLVATVVLYEGVDSDSSSDVQLVGDGGSSNVKPVWVVWSEILETSSLIVGGPLFNY